MFFEEDIFRKIICIIGKVHLYDVLPQTAGIVHMFYGNCPGDDADEFLYKNTDLVQMDMLRVHVQSLEFYYENAEKDSEYYKMVEGALRKKEGLQHSK